MSITIQWDNHEKTVIRWDFAQQWTSEQFVQALMTGMTLVKGVGHTVYGLGVIHNSAPANRLLLPLVDWPANLHKLVFVGTNYHMSRSLAVRNLSRVVFADNLAEAYEQITLLHLKEIFEKQPSRTS